MARLVAVLRVVHSWYARRRKAMVAFVLPGVTLLAPTLLAGDVPTPSEWRVAVATCLVTAFGVERIRNARAGGEHRAEG